MARSSGPKSTLADVAARSGVSAAAASLALRGKAGVSTTTRERVHAAADELGYQVRGGGGAAEDGLSIALVVKSRRGEAETTNAFYGPVIAGISDEAASRDMALQLRTLAVDDDYQPLAPPDLDPDLDGVLLLGTYLTPASAAALAGCPVVLVDGYAAQPGHYSSIVTDNAGGIRSVVDHVLSHGHTSVLLAGANAFPSISARRVGYEAAMLDAGLTPRVIEGTHEGSSELARKTMDAVVADGSITAVVAVNDTVAISLIHEILGRGLRIPDDISIAGFDDIPLAAMLSPGLDTAAVDKPAMGRIAVSLLMHRIRHQADPAYTTTMTTNLRVRGSVGAPRSTK